MIGLTMIWKESCLKRTWPPKLQACLRSVNSVLLSWSVRVARVTHQRSRHKVLPVRSAMCIPLHTCEESSPAERATGVQTIHFLFAPLLVVTVASLSEYSHFARYHHKELRRWEFPSKIWTGLADQVGIAKMRPSMDRTSSGSAVSCS